MFLDTGSNVRDPSLIKNVPALTYSIRTLIAAALAYHDQLKKSFGLIKNELDGLLDDNAGDCRILPRGESCTRFWSQELLKQDRLGFSSHAGKWCL